MALHCAVIGCSNGGYKLEKWKSQICPLHSCRQGCNHCICDPPFRLFTFPTANRDIVKRDRWRKAINRADPKKPWSLLEPSRSMRVCSVHFVDGEPTDANPDPTLLMGHDVPSPKTKVRRNMKKILLTERATCETTFDSHMATTPSATCDMEIPTSATRDLPCTEELQPAGVHLVIALLTVLILILVKQLVDISEEVVKLANELRDLKFKQRKVVERKRNSVSTIAATTAPDQLKLD